jgi:hypothetical protein
MDRLSSNLGEVTARSFRAFPENQMRQRRSVERSENSANVLPLKRELIKIEEMEKFIQMN